MTEAASAPSPFSTSTPNFQLAWDSTSLGWFKECPRLYQYKMIEGWESRYKGLHLAFGGWYASGVERYAHSRANGLSHEAATLAMIKWAMEATGERTLIDCEACEGSGNEAGDPSDRCGQCFGAGCRRGPFTPWESGDPNKNRYTLIRSLVWNVDDRNESNAFTTLMLANGKPAVELSFKFDAFEIAGETIQLCGHLDEVVEFQGALWVADDKTSKAQLDARYFQQYSPHNQMSLYAVAGGIVLSRPVAGVLIRGAQILANGTRFAKGQAPRPKAVLVEWMRETEQWIKLARQYAVDGFWPRNDKSCGNYGGCPFQKVCSVSPSHRQSWLEADFVKREWNPLEERGDI